MKCQLYQLHQIPGSLSFAWHSVVLLLGSWWKWWKYDIFPKRRTFSDDSNPVIFIHFPSISCPKKSSSGAHSRGERWNVSSQKPNWTFTKCSMNMQSCEHATAQEKDKTSYTLYTGNGMLARNMFQAILTAKTYAKKTRHLWFVTSDQYLSISYILIQIRNPNLGRCTKVLTLDSESRNVRCDTREPNFLVWTLDLHLVQLASTCRIARYQVYILMNQDITKTFLSNSSPRNWCFFCWGWTGLDDG